MHTAILIVLLYIFIYELVTTYLIDTTRKYWIVAKNVAKIQKSEKLSKLEKQRAMTHVIKTYPYYKFYFCADLIYYFIIFFLFVTKFWWLGLYTLVVPMLIGKVYDKTQDLFFKCLVVDKVITLVLIALALIIHLF